MKQIRPPAVAGSFYPGDCTALESAVATYLAQADAEPSDASMGAPKALIVPHAGFVYSGPVAASAYVRIAPLRDTVSRVVLLGPSHRAAFRGRSPREVGGPGGRRLIICGEIRE